MNLREALLVTAALAVTVVFGSALLVLSERVTVLEQMLCGDLYSYACADKAQERK